MGIDELANEYDFGIVIPDKHHPFHDAQTERTILHFIKDRKPELIISIGDWIDFYAISQFDKNPERSSKLQEEIDSAARGWQEIRRIAPNATIKYIEGNHEDRMRRYIWKHPELHGLRSLQVESLLGLKDLGIEYLQEWNWKNTFLFTHGKRVGVNAPRQELLDHGISGMSGHTHRIGSASKTDYTGEKVWYSIGHIADPKQAEYVTNPDWIQALGVVHLHRRTKRFYASVVPITEHKLLYDGRLYTPEGVQRLKR